MTNKKFFFYSVYIKKNRRRKKTNRPLHSRREWLPRVSHSHSRRITVTQTDEKKPEGEKKNERIRCSGTADGADLSIPGGDDLGGDRGTVPCRQKYDQTVALESNRANRTAGRTKYHKKSDVCKR